MGEFLVFCNSCVMGAAGYAGVQVGRLQRAIAAETQALEEEEDEEADEVAEAAAAAEAAREAAAGFDEAEAEEQAVAAQTPGQSFGS